MAGYDFDRPYVDASTLPLYETEDRETIAKYGRTARAIEMTNTEYRARYLRLGKRNNMRPPPDGGKIYMGHLVVRRLGTPGQYETWFPGGALLEIYRPQPPSRPVG